MVETESERERERKRETGERRVEALTKNNCPIGCGEISRCAEKRTPILGDGEQEPQSKHVGNIHRMWGE